MLNILQCEKCRIALPFKYFYDIEYGTNPRGSFRNHNQNYELKNDIGNICLLDFDGSSKCTTSSWIQKLVPFIEEDCEWYE